MKMLCITSEIRWFTPLRIYNVTRSGRGVRRWAVVYGDTNRCGVPIEGDDNTWRWRDENDGLVEFVEVLE
jgi:hypothetical protein